MGLQFNDSNQVPKPLRIYTETNHAPELEWVNHLVHPVRAYWGDGTAEWPKWKKDFQFFKTYFQLTDDINEAAVGFLPMTINYYIKNHKLEKVSELANKMERLHKPLYVWLDGDHDVRYNHSNCIFIKYFGNSAKSIPNELIQPGDVKHDLLQQYFSGNLQIRKKNKFPSIGFDGIATYPASKLGFTILKNLVSAIHHSLFQTQFGTDPIIPMLVKRKKILDQLQDIPGIKANFNIRNSFAKGTIGGEETVRREFIQNIINNDYTFCYRGAANYSLRFYETLCLGRIPLFINTNCVLPFAKKINWKDAILWVDQSEVGYLSEKIIDFHQSMTDKQFIEKQHWCREIWVKYLSKEGFCHQFHDDITSRVVTGAMA